MTTKNNGSNQKPPLPEALSFGIRRDTPAYRGGSFWNLLLLSRGWRGLLLRELIDIVLQQADLDAAAADAGRL